MNTRIDFTNRIVCPICTEDGQKKTLASVLENGDIAIRRSSEQLASLRGDYTLVMGSEFKLVCGNCKQVAFRKVPSSIQQKAPMLFGTI